MAAGATIHHFAITLSDADRSVYTALELRVARHPSESAEFLLTRVLAYCLEYTAGLAFSKGLSDPDEPALWVRDLTGALQAWIEVGLPDAERLHRATKACARVVVYAHRDPVQWWTRLAGGKIHRMDRLTVHTMDRNLLAALAARLDRRMAFDLSVAESTLYLTLGEDTLTGVIETLTPGP
jgi:uncharacterized protein YaeQ